MPLGPLTWIAQQACLESARVLTQQVASQNHFLVQINPQCLSSHSIPLLPSPLTWVAQNACFEGVRVFTQHVAGEDSFA